MATPDPPALRPRVKLALVSPRGDDEKADEGARIVGPVERAARELISGLSGASGRAIPADDLELLMKMARHLEVLIVGRVAQTADQTPLVSLNDARKFLELGQGDRDLALVDAVEWLGEMSADRALFDRFRWRCALFFAPSQLERLTDDSIAKVFEGHNKKAPSKTVQRLLAAAGLSRDAAAVVGAANRTRRSR